MTIQEIEQELFEMERKLKSMFNSCSQDLAIGIEKLRGELAELKESKKEGKWKPEKGEEYWHRDDIGGICWTMWDSCEIDIWRYKNIPIFPTQEACEKYWHFMDTVKEKSYEFSEEDWKVGIPKHCVYYSFEGNFFSINTTHTNRYLGEVYFKTEADAQYIIDNFKEELLKYWL